MYKSKLMQTTLRVLQSVPSIIGIIVISFALTRALPGDPAVYFAGDIADEESIQLIREQLGLDRSWLEQLGIYAANLMQGNLGMSLSTGRPVIEELSERLPASLELALFGRGLAFIVGVPLGIVAATRPGAWVDQVGRKLVTAGVSVQTFFSGLLLIFIFYY